MNSKKLFLSLLFLGIFFHSSAQQSCWCLGQTTYCYDNAADLAALLDPSNPTPPQAGETIGLCGTINLGELVPPGTLPPENLFPLVIPPFVTLQGNYNFYNYNNGGTTINFTFLFPVGRKCSRQAAGNLPGPGGDNDGDNEIALAMQNNNNSAPANVMAGTDDFVFVFKLMEGAQLKNLCIVGPKTDTKEQDMCENLNINKALDCSNSPLPSLPPELLAIRGESRGVLMEGIDSQIENCEIYGFDVYGVLVSPDAPSHLGTVKINRCYIHNCKGRGFGYGVYHSAGSSYMICDDNTSATCVIEDCDPNPCIYVTTPLTNSPYQDEILDLKNTFFFENGKDVDATSNRNTIIVNHCTFSERAPEGANINRHDGQYACNDHVLPPSIPDPPCPANPQSNATNNPYPNAKQACNYTLRDVGGNRTWIWNSFFYKGQNNITLPYPNTFDPTSPFTSCANPVGFTPGTSPLIHIGRDAKGLNHGDDTKWNFFVNTRDIKWGRIFIAKTDVNYWDKSDNHIQVTDYGQNIPNVNNDGQNWYVEDETTAPVPMLKFNYGGNGTGPNPNLITQGDVLDFYTFDCRNSNISNGFVYDTDMLYMWRFHETPYDHEDEIRTASVGNNGLYHTFNKVGITNVNLMAIDLNNNFAASTVATQQITVKPPSGNGHVVMVVNLKDTYDGRNLIGELPCRFDRVDYYNDGIENIVPHNPIDHTQTGFQKFIAINGNVIWTEDIARDNGGWERIEMNIENLICTTCPSTQKDNIEIGIRIDPALPGVDGAKVRGITLYIDDVYIQSTSGYNALSNGDFEKSNGTQAADWIPTGSTIKYTYQCPSGISPLTLSNGSAQLTRDEVRSGHSSWSARINTLFANYDAANPYYPGIQYVGNILRGVKQEFNVQFAPPPRLADTTVAVNPGFTLQPNPATFNATINGMVTSIPPNEAYNVKAIAPDGAVVYNTNGKGHAFAFNASFPPGVYFVNVKSKSYNGFKKLVVVK